MVLFYASKTFERKITMGNSKSVKKGAAIVMTVILAVVMVCVSVVCNMLSTKTESSNQVYLDDAKAQLTEYSDNYNYTNFEFMNSLFEKANVISATVTENTSADTNAALVKNLGINSFVMTDADGKIIASSDDKKVGTSVLDDKTTKQFKANLRGMKVKSISEPTAVEGEDGVYNLMACVARTEGGIVIIDTNTSDYSAVIGGDIAKGCKGDTIIVKDGEVVSTNMNLGDNGLKSAGITDEMIRSENFNVTIDGTTYSLSSMPSGEYTIISGQAVQDGGFNMVYGIVIPCAAGVVMLVISIIVINACTTKKKDNE